MEGQSDTLRSHMPGHNVILEFMPNDYKQMNHYLTQVYSLQSRGCYWTHLPWWLHLPSLSYLSLLEVPQLVYIHSFRFNGHAWGHQITIIPYLDNIVAIWHRTINGNHTFTYKSSQNTHTQLLWKGTNLKDIENKIYGYGISNGNDGWNLWNETIQRHLRWLMVVAETNMIIGFSSINSVVFSSRSSTIGEGKGAINTTDQSTYTEIQYYVPGTYTTLSLRNFYVLP